MPRLILIFALLLGGGALADLRIFSSRFYQIHTDLEPGVAQDLATRLDVMHEEYTRRLMRFGDKSAAPRVDAYLFARQSDYLRLAGAPLRSTGGVFIPSRNALAAFHDEQGRDSLRRTLQHEAFHQFAANTIGHPLPMWLNEGMAQYYEEGLWTGDGFTIGQVPPRRVRQLQSDIRAGRLLDFSQFMKLTSDQWSSALGSRAVTRGATQYNQAWAMVHFLVNASDASGQPRFRALFIAMLQRIHEGVDPELAFSQQFSTNLKNFRERFDEWAISLEPTIEATYIERQEVLGDMLLAMYEHDRSFTSMAEFREAVRRARLRIDYSSGQIRWSSGDDTGLYFSKTDGSAFNTEELFLQARRGAPLPDIVCETLPNTTLRTRFYRSGTRILHEMLFEPRLPGSAAGAPLRK